MQYAAEYYGIKKGRSFERPFFARLLFLLPAYFLAHLCTAFDIPINRKQRNLIVQGRGKQHTI